MGWSLGFVLVGYLLVTGAVVGLSAGLAPVAPRLLEGPVGPALLQAAIGIAIFAPLTWLIGRRRLGLSLAELGWAPAGVGLVGFRRGLVVAAGIAAAALLAGVPAESGWGGDGGSPGGYLARVAALAALLLPAALFEELAFRGLLVVGLSRGLGPALGVGISAALFALAHRFNPGIGPLAFGNIALAGVFLGATFLSRGGLWTATGAHLGWNLTLAGLGAPVSGLPFEVPWIDFHPGEPVWLTGGPFGPEGGLLATGALIVGTVLVIRWPEFREAR